MFHDQSDFPILQKSVTFVCFYRLFDFKMYSFFLYHRTIFWIKYLGNNVLNRNHGASIKIGALLLVFITIQITKYVINGFQPELLSGSKTTFAIMCGCFKYYFRLGKKNQTSDTSGSELDTVWRRFRREPAWLESVLLAETRARQTPTRRARRNGSGKSFRDSHFGLRVVRPRLRCNLSWVWLRVTETKIERFSDAFPRISNKIWCEANNSRHKPWDPTQDDELVR